MRYLLSFLSLLFLVTSASCARPTEDAKIDATPVIRTDFSDEATWAKVQKDVAAPYLMGFVANVRFIDDKQYDGLTGQEILQQIPDLDNYGCVFIADTSTMSSIEHHLLVLNPADPGGKTFRVIPSEAWSVENNLSIANMDYEEFLNAADADGVFRGFK